MPEMPDNGLAVLSLFSGCGGLDLGFDRAGFRHVASYDVLSETGKVLKAARPSWTVHSGSGGDVRHVDWAQYRGKIDVLHGGPPCQPFSTAGGRKGADDVRDMVPEFARAVLEVRPNAFVMENVSGLASRRFVEYLNEVLYGPLGKFYKVQTFSLGADDFGVPQKRRRIFFVGFLKASHAKIFSPPLPTHQRSKASNLPRTMGVREALGLSDIGVDALAPTLRSGWTGPRHTTSVVNSATSMKIWNEMKVWPHGVAPTRQAASDYIAKDGHFRLSVPDCMVLQGFPEDWPIEPPVYKALGLIGNSVSPPMAYAVAREVARVLKRSDS
jgi:DNA (cytosine-5)-methyltransferase 1